MMSAILEIGDRLPGRRIQPRCHALLTALVVLLPTILPAQSWLWTDYLPTANPLEGVTYGNGLFVAVGFDGTIVTSTNAQTWVVRTSPTSETLYDVAWGNDRFIAVGTTGTILSSTNGVNWTGEVSGITSDLFGVTFAAGRFVAVGDAYNSALGIYQSVILSSFDGTRWTGKTLPGEGGMETVCHGADTWVAAGYTRSGFPQAVVATSFDGNTWTAQTSGAFTDFGIEDVAFGNGLFVAVGGYGTKVLTSLNGRDWTPRSTGTTESTWKSVTFGDDVFVAVGVDTILSSGDGVHWTVRRAEDSSSAVAFGRGAVVAAGYDLGATIRVSGGHEKALTMAAGRAVEVMFTSKTDKAYQVQFSSNLTNWVDVGGPIPGTGNAISRFYRGTTNFQAFYRVVEQ